MLTLKGKKFCIRCNVKCSLVHLLNDFIVKVCVTVIKTVVCLHFVKSGIWKVVCETGLKMWFCVSDVKSSLCDRVNKVVCVIGVTIVGTTYSVHDVTLHAPCHGPPEVLLGVEI